MLSSIPIARITPSKTNPRKHFDPETLKELADSIRELGVLQPILLRPLLDDHYEIVAGERRFRAAEQAGLEEIPAVVRELDDTEVLEIQVVENLHRADLHPMEEAEGYELLVRRHGYGADEIAAKVGKSKAYVYARLKLCALTSDAREAFLEDRFTAAHAVVLARLPSAIQVEAMNPDKQALFERERVLWNPGAAGDDHDSVKVRSVREFQAWVDKNVRFRAEEADLVFEPETVEAIEAAEAADEKLLPITWDSIVPPQAREGRTWTAKSWKRADGELGSKTCEHSQPAIVVVGPGRGDAFRVCTAKKACKVHWSREIKEAAASAKAGKPDPDVGKDRWKIEQEKREAARKKEEAERDRWEKAIPAIAAAVAARVKEIPFTPGEGLWRLVSKELDDVFDGGNDEHQLVPIGKTPEDFARHIAFLVLSNQLNDRWSGPREFPKVAKSIDVDVRKILNEVAPVKREAKKKGPDGAAAASSSSTKGKSPKRKARTAN